MPSLRRRRTAFSMLEMLAVVTILGIIALIVVPRFSGGTDNAKRSACHVQRGNVEVQCQLWFRHHGSWPQSNLSDIGADVKYFPEGLPVCPLDGSSYVFNTATQRVTGHDH